MLLSRKRHVGRLAADSDFRRMYCTNSNATTGSGHSPAAAQGKKLQNFVQEMRAAGQRVIFFYGSQTGTAEDLAQRLAKEAAQRFGIASRVADIEECDMTVLNQLPSEHLAVFLMATYGEGEPTDSAIEFWDFLIDPASGNDEHLPDFSDPADREDLPPIADDTKPLEHLRFAAFGLGNSTYEMFNQVGRLLDKQLLRLGAQRLHILGEGDDDRSLEEDFIAWKDDLWPHVCQHLGVDMDATGSAAQVATYTVTELPADSSSSAVPSDSVFRGALVSKPTESGLIPTYDAKNPYIAPLATVRELFQPSAQRSCLHLELDISDAQGMNYVTGDHVAVWPVNPEVEVNRLLRVLGLEGQADAIINVATSTTARPGTKLPFPTPTTYRTVLRHCLDIVSPPSRQFFETLVSFAQSEPARQFLGELAHDKEVYARAVHDTRYTMGEVIEIVRQRESDAGVGPEKCYRIPFANLLDEFTRILPRYYSISSSAVLDPKHVHVTAVVLDYQPEPTPQRTVYGVCTNYFKAIYDYLNTNPGRTPNPTEGIVYRDRYPYLLRPDAATGEFEVAMFIRRSNFKLPRSMSTPIIMIGPGTGVAPFRGFVMERSHYAQQNAAAAAGTSSSNSPVVGTTLLFYGCRSQTQDYLYETEWPAYFQHLPAPSAIHCAFSRDQPQKIYVQDLLKQHQELLWELLHEQNAYVYVCGDARHMARDVIKTFVDIAASIGGLPQKQAVNFVKNLRGQGRYQEDVWS
ncbi:hypothetical protein BJ085DRAFT_41672 [Dimargaris cristalligena]|uniref:NADPH--hemoprotein reductase n=1 Tax=Dimargaris cristalligena TaxID=215637 RepID=A0A4P9ZZM8_9FUNG|nr:hypothetical protein BJ085DRAFT_41672 [Dimargaris cristalligena]|eukprot:RKP39167.1 hypothetical protein BJ085DRAFT_41672 [Dimargaris cristalligena]